MNFIYDIYMDRPLNVSLLNQHRPHYLLMYTRPSPKCLYRNLSWYEHLLIGRTFSTYNMIMLTLSVQFITLVVLTTEEQD